MLGAIIGDLAGSIYEFDQLTQHSKVKIKSIIENNSFFSDDTILTVAIADAIINNKTYETTLKEYAIKYGNKIPQNMVYFVGFYCHILKQCFHQVLLNGQRAIIKDKVLVMVQ